MVSSSARPSFLAVAPALLLSALLLALFLLLCLMGTRVHAAPGQDGALVVTHTVGTDRGYCASTSVLAVPNGTQVHFCFTITNNNPVTLTTHMFVMPFLGITATFPSELPPGQTLAVTTGYLTSVGVAVNPELSAVVSGQAISSTVTVFSKTADQDQFGYSGQATARVVVGQAATVITQTVGTIENSCSENSDIAVNSGTTVYYCLTIADTGTLDFVRHEVVAPQLGATFVYTPTNPTVSPQQITAQQVRTTFPPNRFEKTITGPFDNEVTVTSYTADGVAVTNRDTATVVLGRATTTLTYTVGIDPNRCATSTQVSVLVNTNVYYCIQLENTGTLPIERLVINAPQLALQATLTQTVGVGESLVLTRAFNSALAKTVTTSENNSLTVDAYTAGNVRIRTQANATVTLGNLLVSVSKYARKTSGGCVNSAPLNILTTEEFYYCLIIRNTGTVPINHLTIVEGVPTNINFSFDYALAVGQTITLTNDFLANTLKIGSYLGPFSTSVGNISPTTVVTVRGPNNSTVPVNAAFQLIITAPTATPAPTLTPTMTWTPTSTPSPTTTPTVPPTPTPTNVVVSILPTPTDLLGINSLVTPTPPLTDAAGGFVPESPLGQDSFLPTPTFDLFATEMAVTAAAATATALAFEAESTATTIALTQQALQPPIDTAIPTTTPLGSENLSITPTATLLAVAPPTGITTVVGGPPVTTNGPTHAPGYLDLIATTLAVTSTTLGWLWFLAGSIIFFAVAGMFAGLSFRQQERRRYAMVDEEPPLWDEFAAAEDDPFAAWPTPADHHTQPTSPSPSATKPAADDGWPASLP